MRWKWTLILGLTALAVWSAHPLDRKIRLGLDLKGGVHLMLRVVTEDAVRAEPTGQTRAPAGLASEPKRDGNRSPRPMSPPRTRTDRLRPRRDVIGAPGAGSQTAEPR